MKGSCAQTAPHHAEALTLSARAGPEPAPAAGLNILLVSRTQSKLQEAAQLLSSRHSVETSHVVMDLAKARPEQWAALSKSLEGLDVGILVNNCGLSYEHAEFFDKLDEQRAADIVVVNISALNAVRLPLLVPCKPADVC